MIRKKLRFIGITMRRHTSPKTWRWQQHAEWAAQLPASAIRNVSVPDDVWGHFGHRQHKLTPSFRRELWSAEWVTRPSHDEKVRIALLEAKVLVELGRQAKVRRQVIGHLRTEPTVGEPWLRALVSEIGR